MSKVRTASTSPVAVSIAPRSVSARAALPVSASSRQSSRQEIFRISNIPFFAWDVFTHHSTLLREVTMSIFLTLRVRIHCTNRENANVTTQAMRMDCSSTCAP